MIIEGVPSRVQITHHFHLSQRGFESIPSSMFFTLLNLCKVRDPSRSARCLPFARCLLFVSILGKNEFVGEKRVKDNQGKGKHLDPIRGLAAYPLKLLDA